MSGLSPGTGCHPGAATPRNQVNSRKIEHFTSTSNFIFWMFFLVVRLSVLVLSVPVTETKLCEVRNPTQLVYPGRMTRLD